MDHLKTREDLSSYLGSLQVGVVGFTVVEAFVREDKAHAPVLGASSVAYVEPNDEHGETTMLQDPTKHQIYSQG